MRMEMNITMKNELLLLNLLAGMCVAMTWAAEPATANSNQRSGGQPAAAVAGADELARGFARPSHEAKPWVYWWFLGNHADPQGMARDIAEMKAKGIGGVMHMQTEGGDPKYGKMLGPQWDAWFGEMLKLAHAGGMTLSPPPSPTAGATAAGGSARRMAPSNWCIPKRKWMVRHSSNDLCRNLSHA